MKDRLKAIRKESKVNQQEFAESLGLSRSYISQLEADMFPVSDRTIRDICRVYRINEEWLRFGTGPMHIELSRDQQIVEFVNDALESEDDDIRKTILYAATQLDEEDWKALIRIIKKLKD